MRTSGTAVAHVRTPANSSRQRRRAVPSGSELSAIVLDDSGLGAVGLGGGSRAGLTASILPRIDTT
jgi:hypothetical protein